MDRQCNTVALFADSLGMQAALRALREAGFDMGKLSVIGKNQHQEVSVTGMVVSGNGTQYWGRFGALAGSLWRPRGGSALLLFPGVGQVVIFGPLVNAVGSALGAAAGTALGSTLASIGLPPDSALRYDSAIRQGRLALLAQGVASEAQAARRLLERAGATEVHEHAAGGLPPAPPPREIG
jgi:uncharacterized membrane protein